MLVMNPTKKTLPLFSHIEKVDNEKSAKHFSKINPFYSWHANYVTVNRKKVLFLVNDLTFFTGRFSGYQCDGEETIRYPY